ncbi:phosphotransferase [Kribbella sp. DT2]|uniref:phosphotransferase n=1 Tax=Kribbella sp. DT2 TaxID=3393427 RepID=UPI003CEE3147
MASATDVLHHLVTEAGLPAVASATPLTGYGFDHEILHAVLTDGREVVLRHRPASYASPSPAAPDPSSATGAPASPTHILYRRAEFLAAYDVPAPALLAATAEAGLYEYAPGDMLLTLIEQRRMTDQAWHSVGTAFRRLHAVHFPKRLTGAFGNGTFDLDLTDPVRTQHELLDKARLELVGDHLPKLHALIDQYADQLRETPTALLHRDVYPANLIVGPDRTMLIDWDSPQVGDPGIEIAALEEHVYLLGAEIPPAFYTAYGHRPATTALHRVTGAIGWLAEGWLDDWAEDTLDPVRSSKATSWRSGLQTYLSTLPELLRQA